MKVVSKEDLRVATLSGSVFMFTANEAAECSDEIGLVAMQMGAKLVSESKDKIENKQPVDESVEGRATYYGESGSNEDIPPAELVAVMEALIQGGDPVNFKSDGSPKANVVNKAAGRTVSTNEREAAWEEALNS